MFDHIRSADRVVLLINTLLLMIAALLPFATSVLAESLRSGHEQRIAVGFYGLAFAAKALTFNATWSYARRHGLLAKTLTVNGETAISRRFQLALAWLSIGTLIGCLLPVLGIALIAAFNAFYWLPIPDEYPSHASTDRGTDGSETTADPRRPGAADRRRSNESG